MGGMGSFPGFDTTIGLDYTELTADRVVATCKITPELQQPYGIVHGGVYCTLVESTASVGAALWLGDRGNVVGVSNHTNFLRAKREGTVTATATPVHRGRTQQLWQVVITDEDGRDIARGEVRLANLASADGLGRNTP
ncbi:PaaI family thioesterase [Thermomonospora amylolytica]|uniref:PaaI family thioesterase n=1 Tax=Thermomonospora amylolytica TaxID=1411117 RepID=UPI000E6C4105|nr:PaaI family thioesterase [Thermomonospora amylolytica]